MPPRPLATLVVSLLAAAPALAQEKITYQDHVRPIFTTSCISCHNPDKNSAGLNLTSYQGAVSGSSNGKVLVPGDPDSSQLYLSVTHQQEPKMPLRASKLSDKNLDTIRQWIEGGLLETGTSVAMTPARPKLEMKLTAAPGRPKGPPPMPAGLPLDPVARAEQPAPPASIAASPWAPLVALAGPHQILLYHADSHDLLGVLPFPDGPTPKTLSFSRNGSLLLAGGGVGGEAGKVALFDVPTGRRLTTIADELDYDEVLAADIAPDHSAVVFGGPTRLLRVHSVETGQPLHKIEKHTDWILAVAYSPDGVLLASADRAGGLHVWEAASGSEFYTLTGHKGPITALRFRADSNVLASASEDGTVRLWDMNTGSQIRSIPAHPSGVLSLDFAPDGRLVTAGRDRAVRLWSPDGKKLRDLESLPDVALHAAFAGEGKLVVASDFSGQVRLHHSADGKRAGQLDPNPPSVAQRLVEGRHRLAAATTAHDKAAAALSAARTAATAKPSPTTKPAAATKPTTSPAVDKLAQAQAAFDATARDLAAARASLRRWQRAQITTDLFAARQQLADLTAATRQSADALQTWERSLLPAAATQSTTQPSPQSAAAREAVLAPFTARLQSLTTRIRHLESEQSRLSAP